MPQVDVLGRQVQVGDFVHLPDAYSRIGQIKRLTPKMIVVCRIDRRSDDERRFYAKDCALLPEEDVQMWLLSRPIKENGK